MADVTEDLWTEGSIDQADFEKNLVNKANEELVEHENALDQKRLDKTVRKKASVESHVATLERKIADPRTLISQRERLRNEVAQLRRDTLDQLVQDEKDIKHRINLRNSTGKPDIKPDADETEHEFLVRTGRITPFSKPGTVTADFEDDRDADHRTLSKPAQQFDSSDTEEEDWKTKANDNDFEEGSDDAEDDALSDPVKVRDDGILSDYKRRLASWDRLKERNKEKIPEDVVLDAKAGFKVPGDIWKRLFGYQKTGVRWLWELYSQRVGGIIGDEMGLGKTVQVAAFIASLHHSGLLDKPVMIVCPATVLDQWVDELHQWWPPLRVAILHSIGTAMGSKRTRANDDNSDSDSDLSDFDQDGQALSESKVAARGLINSIHETGHILVTTYSGIKIYEEYIVPRTWGYCCLDEGHKIRNPDSEVSLACKQVKTPYRLILSGTPIQNNLTELWSLFDFIFPGRLGTLPVFQAQFSVPINVGGYANATNIQVQTAYKCAVLLRDMIAPYMLRRMKSDVASDLPAKTEKVLFCKLTKPQKQAYLTFLKSEELASIMKGRRQVLFGVDILRKICNHPDLVVRDVDKRNYGDPHKSGKMQVVGSLLGLWHSQGHRTLLFSQTKQMLDILEMYVKDLGLTYMRMDGSTAISQRQQLVGEFNKNEAYSVFLLTTKVGGLGVNLTGANRVIIYDPDWNPSTDIQARERAWRLGQKKEVIIYRLMITGSIEEKIYQRQIFKQFLSNKILKDPKQKRFFKNTDLHDLFTLGDTSESADLFNGNDIPPQKSPSPVPKRRKTSSAEGAGDQDDLSTVTGVSRESNFYPGAGTGADEGSSVDRQESSLLEGIFAKAGVQSTLEHDAVINASRPDTVLMEREAERVASQAAEALRQSRRTAQRSKIGTPTWTGRSGLAGKLKLKSPGPRDEPRSSFKILQGLRQKKELESQSKNTEMLRSSELNQHANVMRNIKAYLEAQPNNEAQSADIVSACEISLDSPQHVSNLRQILRKIATWDGKKWRLVRETES